MTVAGFYRARGDPINIGVRFTTGRRHMVDYADEWEQVHLGGNPEQRCCFGGLHSHFRRSCPP